VERMNLNPLPNETSLNPAVPEKQLCLIPDLNELLEEQEDNARASELATDGFVPSTLQKREQFLRQAFQHLRDSSYPGIPSGRQTAQTLPQKISQKMQTFLVS
jgi:hypothetical protein